MRGYRLLAAAVLPAVLLGCTTLPSSGPVTYSDEVPGQDVEDASVQVFATGPVPGASPLGIVRGFLEAMSSGRASEGATRDVAREYLTPGAQKDWHPDRTIVYENLPGSGPEAPLQEPGSGRVVLEATKLAEIAPDGTWEPAEEGEPLTVRFGLAEVDGEWRIGRPPTALLMSRWEVDQWYERYNRYFFDPEFQILVPDPVFIPVRGTLETLLVQSLLRGPSQWLKPAVRTAIPGGTELATPSVVVEAGVAKVDLDDKVLDLAEAQRRLMVAQLVWTLKEAGVQRVQVTVDQSPLPIAHVEGPDVSVDEWATFDPAGARASTMPYAVSDGRVVVLRDSSASTLNGPLGSGDIPVRSVAPSLSGDRVAAVTKDGTQIVVSEVRAEDGSGDDAIEVEVVAKGTDLLTPSWDRTGRLWVVDRRDGAAEIMVLTQEGETLDVTAEELTGRDVRALRVARDGVRVAATVETGNASEVVVGRVHDGDEVLIDGVRALPVPTQVSSAHVAWAEVDELVVLGHNDEEPPQPVLISVDGSTTAGVGSSPFGRFVDSPAARTVAGAPGAPLLVGSTDNQLWVQHPTLRWIRRGDGHSPAYPG